MDIGSGLVFLALAELGPRPQRETTDNEVLAPFPGTPAGLVLLKFESKSYDLSNSWKSLMKIGNHV